MAGKNSAFGERLSAMRRARHLAQSALAERAGVSTEFVSRLERGATLPSLPTLMQFCEALGCTPNDLLLPASAKQDRAERLYSRLRAIDAKIARDAIRVAEAVIDYETRQRP